MNVLSKNSRVRSAHEFIRGLSVMRLIVVIVMAIFYCCANVRRRQHRKHEGLQECHQQFDKVHERGKCATNNCAYHTTAEAGAVFTKYKDQTNQTQDNDVTSGYVGEKTNHQGERFDDQTEHFYWRQNRFDPSWNAGHPENVLPVVAIAIDVGDNKGKNGQYKGYRQVTCYVGTTWEERHQTQEVAKQDEEEQSQDERHKTLVVF